MRRAKTGLRAGALALALVMVAAACDDNGSDDDSGGDSGGSIVVGAEEFPSVLNPLSFDGGDTSWTAWMVGPALARGYRLLPDLTYEPWLFEDDCTLDSEEPFTVSCRIREEATWSDGTPLTAEDFEFTYQTIVDPDFDALTRVGYEDISSFEVTSPTEFTMTFAQPFVAYQDLWASSVSSVLPKHVLEGADFNTVWNSCICDPATGDPIGSGSFLVESFRPDEELKLTKNDGYWDGEAKVDEVVFVPTPDTDSELNNLDGDDVQVIYPQATTNLAERLGGIDGATFDTAVGASWEHLDLLVTEPGLDDPVVRQAIATALPRQQVVDTVVRPIDDDVGVLNNSIYVTTQDEYVPNWDIYPADGDVDAANALLDDAGWTREGDGTRSKDGVELSFTIGTTAGDAGREETEQIIQERLAEIGVALTVDNAGDDFFDRLDAGEYPMAIFAFDASPDPLVGVNDTYVTDAALNATHQSNEEVDALIAESNIEIDAEARAAKLNAADRVMAEDVVSVIPLYQKPAVLAYRTSVGGLEVNVTVDGFTWNIEEWERTG